MLSVCVSPRINFSTAEPIYKTFGMYNAALTPTSPEYVIDLSALLVSMCLSPVVARQRLYEKLPLHERTRNSEINAVRVVLYAVLVASRKRRRLFVSRNY
jgi:hypothetical protein